MIGWRTTLPITITVMQVVSLNDIKDLNTLTGMDWGTQPMHMLALINH
jgi:hypothetical protein